jgi:hypothetical protein
LLQAQNQRFLKDYSLADFIRMCNTSSMAPRGGFREGAGRKPLKASQRRNSLTVRVKPSSLAILKAFKKANHCKSFSQAFDLILEQIQSKN